MSERDTLAGHACAVMHKRLTGFCSVQGSITKAAAILKTDELSEGWLKAFAGGAIVNPTVGKLRALEHRMDEIDQQRVAT